MGSHGGKVKPISDGINQKELTIDISHSKTETDKEPTKVDEDNETSILFKIYIIIGIVGCWGSYNILIKYTVVNIKEEDRFFSAVVPVFCEILKLILVYSLYFRESNYSVNKFCNGIYNEIILKPVDFLKISPPAVCFILQNNLEIIAAQNLSPGVYQVTCQLKIVASALFMVIFLKKNQSFKRWICIFLIFLGIVISPFGEEINNNVLIGLASVFAISILTGFASVYFEKMLKNGSQSSLWLRSIQLYSWGLLAAIICMASKNTSGILEKGIFHGFTYIVWFSIIVLAIGGLYTSLIVKYLNSLYKCFASTITIALVASISVFLFNSTLSTSFIISFSIVVISIITYNLVS
uniref:UDP-galactose translocator 1 n=1 Tax=Parastrongyloides trichosuri TaxID=131310 RepID=A0A0N4Z295_PARTI